MTLVMVMSSEIDIGREVGTVLDKPRACPLPGPWFVEVVVKHLSGPLFIRGVIWVFVIGVRSGNGYAFDENGFCSSSPPVDTMAAGFDLMRHAIYGSASGLVCCN